MLDTIVSNAYAELFSSFSGSVGTITVIKKCEAEYCTDTGSVSYTKVTHNIEVVLLEMKRLSDKITFSFLAKLDGVSNDFIAEGTCLFSYKEYSNLTVNLEHSDILEGSSYIHLILEANIGPDKKL